MVTFILLLIFHVIIRLLIPSTVVVHFLYTASEITSIYTEILVQYHSKATDTVCSIKLKREEFLYIRTIFNFQAECVLIYMLLFYQISAWVFLIHMFLYAGFYCFPCRPISSLQMLVKLFGGIRLLLRSFKIHRQPSLLPL